MNAPAFHLMAELVTEGTNSIKDSNMSRDAGITIHYVRGTRLYDLIDTLLANNWSFNDHGSITFMDNDDFDFLSADLRAFDNVKKILEERLKMRRIVGIALVIEAENTGGIFLFDPGSDRLSSSICINRSTLADSLLIDYSYYLENLRCVIDYPNVATNVQCSDG